MSSIAQFWEEQFNDDSNNPFDGVQVYHYEAGTTTTKNIWTDRGKTTVSSQPHVGDSHGFVWFYGDGLYHLRVTDKNGILLYDWDNVDISPDSLDLDPSACEVGMVPVYVGPDATFECDFLDLGNVRGCLPIANCGTGTDDIPEAGSLLIGNSAGGYSVNKLTAGTGITVTNGNGTITLAVSLSASAFGSTGQRSSVASDSTFTLAADQVVLRTASGANVILDSPASLTNNVTTSGPTDNNGRDTASAFADNSWIHFYWIYDLGDSTITPVRAAALKSLSSAVAPPTGPTLPTNYTHWSYAGAVRWSGSALVATYIQGANAYYAAKQIVFDGGAFSFSAGARNGSFTTAENSVDCSTAVPPNALDMFPSVSINTAFATSTLTNFGIGIVAGKILHNYVLNSGPSGQPYNFEPVLPNLSQRFYWQIDQAADHYGFIVNMSGYRLPNNGG